MNRFLTEFIKQDFSSIEYEEKHFSNILLVEERCKD